MPYIGQSPSQAAFLTNTFSGNGSTTAFTTSVGPANSASVLISISGVVQDPSTYSVSGTTLTFSAAPPSGTNNISCRYLGIPASGVTTTAFSSRNDYTATASQTSFTVASYTPGFIQVYRNGVLLGTADYTATTGTTVVLASAATVGDLISVVSFYVSSVLNAIPASTGAVSTGYIANGAVGTAQLASGAVGTSQIASGISLSNITIASGSILNSSGRPMAAQTGGILQVVMGTLTSAFTTTNTSATSVFTVSITPSSSSSKVLVLVNFNMTVNNDSGHGYGFLQRNSSNIFVANAADLRPQTTWTVNNFGGNGEPNFSISYLDSPATTSATTYGVAVQSSNGTTIYVNRSVRDNDGSQYDTRTVSSIIAMEIAG